MCITDVRLNTRPLVLHISLIWLIPAFRDKMLALPVSVSAMSDLSYGVSQDPEPHSNEGYSCDEL